MNDQSGEAIVLMGPFGSGKSFLGRQLREAGLADYVEMEPIVYARFANGDDFDVEGATAFLRQTYWEQINNQTQVVALESTGVVQRPLLEALQAAFAVRLIWVRTPKAVCLERVAQRNLQAERPITPENAEQFYDFWTNDIAPSYAFALEVDGTHAPTAIQAIQQLLNKS